MEKKVLFGGGWREGREGAAGGEELFITAAVHVVLERPRSRLLPSQPAGRVIQLIITLSIPASQNIAIAG